MIKSADKNVSDLDVQSVERSACQPVALVQACLLQIRWCLTEALGLSLPGNGSCLATHVDRKQLFLNAGTQIVELCRKFYQQDDYSVLPRSIATKSSI